MHERMSFSKKAIIRRCRTIKENKLHTRTESKLHDAPPLRGYLEKAKQRNGRNEQTSKRQA